MELFFLKPLNLYVRPVSGTFVWNLLTLMWNLDPKPLCGIFMWSFYPEPSWQTFLRNVYVDSFSETLEPLICGTWELVRVEPLCETLGSLRVEHLCGTLGTLNWTFKSGTLMWNLGKPEWNIHVEPWGPWTFKGAIFMWNLGKLNLYVELGEPGSRFWAAAPNHPEALLEEPQAFRASCWGKKRGLFSFHWFVT